MNKWDMVYMDTAKRFASLSYANRLQVGAIAVKDNRIISVGYNGTVTGEDNNCEDENGNTKPSVIHAEMNLIAKCARDGQPLLGSTIYITHAPCVPCSRMLYICGIERLVWADMYRDMDGAFWLRDRNILVEQL